MEADTEAAIDFACPRCGTTVQGRFYGPCPTCRDKLIAMFAGGAHHVEVDRFEPALHVVPNQVATKE